MATWYDFIQSIYDSLTANATLAGVPVIVGKDEPFPKAAAIRLLRGDDTGERRLRARSVSTKKPIEIIVEVWEESQTTNPLAGYEKLATLEGKVDTALEAWADSPPELSGVQFYPAITRRVPSNDELTRPMVGSRATLQIDYI